MDPVLTPKKKLLPVIKFRLGLLPGSRMPELGENLIKAAEAEDKIIEAIEHTEHPWCIGVQWHPEFLITDYDKLLLSNFVKVSSN